MKGCTYSLIQSHKKGIKRERERERAPTLSIFQWAVPDADPLPLHLHCLHRNLGITALQCFCQLHKVEGERDYRTDAFFLLQHISTSAQSRGRDRDYTTDASSFLQHISTLLYEVIHSVKP